ncbi:hypothetical protein MGSAQ_003318 [marine sediment metagenome]|uniref:Uncharacterized protein n=1 Tax=marine sediment metagenome TaxID=412755 RepID=A0A1B6NP78_9ZZZZ
MRRAAPSSEFLTEPYALLLVNARDLLWIVFGFLD